MRRAWSRSPSHPTSTRRILYKRTESSSSTRSMPRPRMRLRRPALTSTARATAAVFNGPTAQRTPSQAQELAVLQHRSQCGHEPGRLHHRQEQFSGLRLHRPQRDHANLNPNSNPMSSKDGQNRQCGRIRRAATMNISRGRATI